MKVSGSRVCPWASSGQHPGFCAECQAACSLLGIRKDGENLASLHPLSCSTLGKAPFASPYAQQHRVTGWQGAEHGAEGMGSRICPRMFIGNMQM